jgi:hypothetical protein
MNLKVHMKINYFNQFLTYMLKEKKFEIHQNLIMI